jgi:hypothetical protein
MNRSRPSILWPLSGAILGAAVVAGLPDAQLQVAGDVLFRVFVRPFMAMVEFGLSCF